MPLSSLTLHPLALLATLCLSPGLLAQGGYFVGAEGGVGDVQEQVQAQGQLQGVPGLSGLRLLPVDFAGRTPLETFLADRPELQGEGTSAPRLVLPASQGRLYRFERGDGSSGGFFMTRPGVLPQLLIEVPSAPGSEAFRPEVAVAADGSGLLVTSTLASGGDLYEIDLPSAVVHPRSAQLPAMSFQPGGLALGATFGLWTTSTGVFRFARQPGAQASSVAFEGAPVFFGAPLVLSGDRQTAAAIAGSAAQAARVFTLTASGPALAAHPTELTIGGAGFAQETVFGPYLALSEDGSHVGFTIETALTREVFLARTKAAPASVQLSSDQNYLDTLDEIGLLHFVPGGNRLAYAVGAKAPPAAGQPGLGFERVDFYAAELPTGQSVPQLQNLSLSSGDAVAPFTGPSSLNPDTGVYLLPGGVELVLHDSKSNRLLSVALGSSPALTLLDQVKSLDGARWTGSGLALSVRSEPQQGPRRQLLVHHVSGQPLHQLANLPDGAQFLDLTASPSGLVAARLVFGLDQWLARVDPATGLGGVAWPSSLALGPVLDFDPTNALRTSLSNQLLPGLCFRWTAPGGLVLDSFVGQAAFPLP